MVVPNFTSNLISGKTLNFETHSKEGTEAATPKEATKRLRSAGCARAKATEKCTNKITMVKADNLAERLLLDMSGPGTAVKRQQAITIGLR